jgi:cysteinyl-tRNA synthetase
MENKKDDEPSWEYILDGKDLTGRPGWHIECSAMSVNALGQPFDIHTGGIDLIFPHHENEIAQNTGINSKKLANVFVHNEHLLVDNNKMSKSLNNFYTLEDIKDNNIMPLALRMFVLQAHYRSVLHFTWDNLKSAENRLKNYQAIADLRWQPIEQSSDIDSQCIDNIENNIKNALNDDLDTPKVLEILSEFENKCAQSLINKQTVVRFNIFLDFIDDVLGFNLKQSDISKDIKSLIADRDRARSSKEYAVADQKRDQLKKNGIAIRDTENGTIWYRI